LHGEEKHPPRGNQGSFRASFWGACGRTTLISGKWGERKVSKSINERNGKILNERRKTLRKAPRGDKAVISTGQMSFGGRGIQKRQQRNWVGTRVRALSACNVGTDLYEMLSKQKSPLKTMGRAPPYLKDERE